MGAIEKLISESGVVTGLSAVGGMIGGLADAARAELASLRAENQRLTKRRCSVCNDTGHLDDAQAWDDGQQNSECPYCPDKVAALRAENARLKEALEHAASYMVTLRMDRPAREDGEIVGHWQTEGWLLGLRELAEECATIARDTALSGAPAGIWLSLEQAREIEWAAEGCDVRGGEVTTYDACPACGGAHPRFEPNQPSQLGHATDCFLAAKIKQAEEASHV